MREDWLETTLGKSCEFYNGKAHENQIDDNGEFIVVNSKFISSDGITIKRTNKALFPLYKNDIVMVMSDVPNGKALAKCYFIEENNKYSLNQRICAIRSNKFDVKYLYYHLNRHPYLLSFNNGENQTNLRKDDILKCPLYLPPLPEQKRIVAILDETFQGIDRAISNTEKNLSNARELFESYLNSIFSQKGEGWVEKTLGDVCDFLNGFAFKSTDTVNSSDVQLIRMGNLYQNILDLERKPVFYPNEFRELYGKYIISEGDLIMSLTGTVDKEDYGYTVEVPKTKKTLLLNQRIVKFINIDSSYLDKKFFLHLLRTKSFLNALYNSSRGVRQANLSSLSMKEIQISLPPVEIQKFLVLEFRALETETQRLENIYRQKIAALKELKQRITAS